jgi:peptidoglycan hydrolase CwlO-like protein
METILTLLGSSTLTALVGYFMGRKKQNAETDNTLLRNLEIGVEVYGEIIEGLRSEIQKLRIEINELETKVDQLVAENNKLKTKIKTNE